MIAPVIQTNRLTRYFGQQAVVRDLNMSVPSGQVTALLGLNGAGKTTTIRIIMGQGDCVKRQCLNRTLARY